MSYVNYSTSSGLKTAAGAVSTMPGSLMGIDVMCSTSGSNLVTVYDSENSTTAGKTVLCVVQADAGLVGINHEFFAPVSVNRGIYVAVTGTGTDYGYIVRFCL